MAKRKKILLYIKADVPTAGEAILAEKLGAACRNVRFTDHDRLETCEEVAGEVPEGYKTMKGVKILDVKVEEPKKEPAPAAAKPGDKPAAGAKPAESK